MIRIGQTKHCGRCDGGSSVVDWSVSGDFAWYGLACGHRWRIRRRPVAGVLGGKRPAGGTAGGDSAGADRVRVESANVAGLTLFDVEGDGE